MVKLGDGCIIQGLHPQMQIANCLLYALYQRFGVSELLITHALDGKHGQGSLHPKGRACDYRTWEVSPMRLYDLVLEARRILGTDYDVVLEPTHLHVEYDPDNPKII